MTSSTVVSYERTQSQAISKYIKSIYISNKKTASTYFGRLLSFERFIKENYDFSVDELTLKKVFSVDIYDLLSNYVSWLDSRVDNKGSKSLSSISIKNGVVNVKNFLEYCDIPINQHKFKMRVKLPRVYIQYKESIPREMIIKILETCENFKLKTYLICLAATGARASEMCSLRLKDIDWTNNKINIRAEFTKTKVGRYCFITEECKNFLKTWIDYKYRRRRLRVDNVGDQWVYPHRNDDDLVFSSSFTRDGSILSTKRSDKHRKIDEINLVGNIYNTLVIEFDKVMNQLNIGYEDKTKRRHVFTLHSFRRYVRTIISDLGYQDFADWMIGHINSTYWRKSEKEKYQLFRKIEPHLLLLDQTVIQSHGRDMQTRLEVMERENQELRQYAENWKSVEKRLSKIAEEIGL